ncbi:hypothetical protein ACMD2_22208 [Ananas comosus]|uniref:DUF3511 domain-containing protein n=1 Tax=Ananas comosus TaxID=4615 RepID=A0A199VQD9_ANACO|nr:hypothetical protein ACMD2_22208 [Ananas comosus]
MEDFDRAPHRSSDLARGSGHYYYDYDRGEPRAYGFGGLDDRRAHPPPPPPLALPQPPPFSSSSSAAAAAGAGAGAWCFGDPEMRRRRRVASYKAYAAEGRVKATFRRGFRWIKEKCSEIIHGW